MKKVCYLNLSDAKTGLQVYDTIEAYKVCENLTNHFFGGADIREKPTLVDDVLMMMLEITIDTEKDVSLFLF